MKALPTEYVHPFYAIYDGPFHIDPEALEEGRFGSLTEIEEHFGTGLFHPNLEQDLPLLKTCLAK